MVLLWCIEEVEVCGDFFVLLGCSVYDVLCEV